MKRTLGILLVLGLGLLVGCQTQPRLRLILDGKAFTLPGTWVADLDTASLPGRPAPSTADVFWEQGVGTKRYWVPMYGARFAVMGFSQPSPADCLRAPLSDAPIDGSDGPTNQIPSGTYLCGRTAERRIAIVLVEHYGRDLDLRVWIYQP